jgi:hypothetical protein
MSSVGDVLSERVLLAPKQRLTRLGFLVLAPKKKSKDKGVVEEEEEEGDANKAQRYDWAIVLGGTK